MDAWTHRPEGAEILKPKNDTFRSIGELVAEVIDQCAKAYRQRSNPP